MVCIFRRRVMVPKKEYAGPEHPSFPEPKPTGRARIRRGRGVPAGSAGSVRLAHVRATPPGGVHGPLRTPARSPAPRLGRGLADLPRHLRRRARGVGGRSRRARRWPRSPRCRSGWTSSSASPPARTGCPPTAPRWPSSRTRCGPRSDALGGVYVGRVASAGVCRFTAHLPAEPATPVALADCRPRRCATEYDPHWAYVRDMLAPGRAPAPAARRTSPWSRSWPGQGDPLAVPREVAHVAFFPARPAAEAGRGRARARTASPPVVEPTTRASSR